MHIIQRQGITHSEQPRTDQNIKLNIRYGHVPAVTKNLTFNTTSLPSLPKPLSIAFLIPGISANRLSDSLIINVSSLCPLDLVVALINPHHTQKYTPPTLPITIIAKRPNHSNINYQKKHSKMILQNQLSRGVKCLCIAAKMGLVSYPHGACFPTCISGY